VYDSKEKDHGHSKYEKFQGVVRIQNDTLYFSRKDMNGAGDQAVFKNDMLEFFNEAKMFRLAVTQNHTSLKSALDLSAHSDYALFSYYPSKKNDYNKPYDLSQAEFDVVRSLIACVFEENKDLRNPEAEFIKQLEQNKSDNVIGIWDDFAVNLKSYDGKSTGVFNWYYHPDGEYSKRQTAGEGTFEIKTVNGVEMLVFKPSAEYHKQRPGNMVGSDFVFAANDKRIWLGEVSYKDVKQQFSLSGYSQFANKEFLESVLEGLKFSNGFLPAFPFDAAD
jgi:hypothetical protein